MRLCECQTKCFAYMYVCMYVCKDPNVRSSRSSAPGLAAALSRFAVAIEPVAGMLAAARAASDPSKSSSAVQWACRPPVVHPASPAPTLSAGNPSSSSSSASAADDVRRSLSVLLARPHAGWPLSCSTRGDALVGACEVVGKAAGRAAISLRRRGEGGRSRLGNECRRGCGKQQQRWLAAGRNRSDMRHAN